MQNRGFISQLKLWGWREKKVSGDFTTMVAPNGTKLQVRSAHTHTGNAPETYEQALAAMRITWDEFVAKGKVEADHVVGGVLRSLDYENHPADAERLIDAVAEQALAMEAEAEAERQRIRDKQIAERDRRRAERKAARPTPPEKEDTPVTPAATGSASSGRGNADRVFQLILGTSGPITNSQISEQLGIDKVKAGGAANYLFNELGVIDRVKRGVWIRKHEYSPHDMTVDVVSRNLDLIPEDARPPKAPVPIRPSVNPQVRADRDRLLDDVLDQLLPDGFMGRHLSLIARWRDETLAMIDLVEADR